MTKKERKFLGDIEDAVENYNYDIEHYHEDGYDGRYFTVIVNFDEDDYDDDAWDCLQEVADDWDAGIDDEGPCSIGLSLSVD